MKNTVSTCTVLCLTFIALLFSCNSGLPGNHGRLDMKLFLTASDNQPLIVAFGGSEGGNAWASDRWRTVRESFLDSGYAMLTIGYFGRDGLPDKLDRISLDAIHDSIYATAKRYPAIDAAKIILIGGSKGGELVLNLASRYEGYSGVIAISPAHVSFPAHTLSASTSSWWSNGKEVSFVPSTWSSVPALLHGDLRAAFTDMLEDSSAVIRARIPVEKSNCPVLLMTGTQDEMWPAYEMCEALMRVLENENYAPHFEHLSYVGDHAVPLDHFDDVHRFLNEHTN